MKTEIFNLWDSTPGMCEETPTLTMYIPDNKITDSAVVILPGGGYAIRAEHEGKGYAEFLAQNGISTFVCEYRVLPHKFPLPLLDARRAIRYIKYNAKKFGIDKNKIAIMGSSAGGHLAALTSTYFKQIEFEGIDDIDNEDCIPNAQILAYPVIKLSIDETISNIGTCLNLLESDKLNTSYSLTPQNIISDKTPKCFIWSTFTDNAVPVSNTIDYATALHNKGISVELHVFPDGGHGLGLGIDDSSESKHISQWGKYLLNWLKYIGF